MFNIKLFKKIKALYLLILLILLMPAISMANSSQDTVILMHGIGQSKWNMYGIEYALKKEGYHVINLKYPSTKKNIAALSEDLNATLCQQKVWGKSYQKIHFVTHSMGGIVVREYLEKYRYDIPMDKLGRVVILAPPNQGSEIANLLSEISLYQASYGPAGQDLRTSYQSGLNRTAYYQLGIIAGKKSWPYMISSRILPKMNDGRVTVNGTKLSGMVDHVVMNVTHTGITWDYQTYQHIIHFLSHGNFEKS